MFRSKIAKYEVDFFDVNVMDATENGLKAVFDFAQSVDMSVDPAGTMREALTMIKAHIDSIVGEGVTEECFGDSMNWVEIMEACSQSAGRIRSPVRRWTSR